MQVINDSEKLKDIFKQAIIEAVEDATMIHAIQTGEKSGTASRADVFDILEGKA